jgi:hypothetical protein
MGDTVRIGGKQYSWNSTLTRFDGQAWRGLQKLDWSEKLEVETVYAQTQNGVPIGDTAGEYSVDSFTFTMISEYAAQLLAYLAGPAPGFPPGSRGLPGSYGQTKFQFQFSASEPLEIGALPILISASPCRITSKKESREKGSGTLVTEFGCWVRQMQINGVTMYSPQPFSP